MSNNSINAFLASDRMLSAVFERCEISASDKPLFSKFRKACAPFSRIEVGRGAGPVMDSELAFLVW